jgi:hypothetical protein
MGNSRAAKNRYEAILDFIFKSHFTQGANEFVFDRGEIDLAAKHLQIELPKNLGDLIYSFRYRVELPQSIRETATAGNEWIIEAATSKSGKRSAFSCANGARLSLL